MDSGLDSAKILYALHNAVARISQIDTNPVSCSSAFQPSGHVKGKQDPRNPALSVGLKSTLLSGAFQHQWPCAPLN